MDQFQRRAIVRNTDFLFWASLFMFIGIRVCVLLLFSITATETGAEIQAVQTAYEANPIFKSLMQLKGIGYMLQFLIIPSFGCALYFLFRRKVLYDDYNVDTLQFMVLFIFWHMLFNFINDVVQLIGRIM